MKSTVVFFITGLVFILFPLSTSGILSAHATSNCVITSFTASSPNNVVSSGESTTLIWSTTGCNYVILSGGASDPNLFRQANSFTTTGPLTTNTTYTLYGNGYNSSSAPVTLPITVNGGAYTASPTNVGPASVRLNGIALNANESFVGYFEIGKNGAQFEKMTTFQYLSPGNNIPFSDTLNVEPNTTYYYQAFVRVGQNLYKGNIVSFTTPSADNTVLYPDNSSTKGASTTTQSSGILGNDKSPAAVTLTIKNEKEKITVGDVVSYTVTYANNTSKKLSSVVLSVVFPTGFTVQQTTQGQILNPTNVSVDLGTLAPGQTGSVFIQAHVDSTVSLSDPLVINATLLYTLPNGVHDSTVGYVINHASRQNLLAGFSLGSGFFPSTIFGWMITVIIILAIILIARRIAKAKKADAHGHGAHH